MSNQMLYYIMGASVGILILIIIAYFILSKKMNKSEYLKANGSLICDKTVRNTVRGYLKGEIDITIKEEDLEEQIEENEKKISDELVRVLVEQQDKIKSQKAEIANLKKKGIGTYGE